MNEQLQYRKGIFSVRSSHGLSSHSLLALPGAEQVIQPLYFPVVSCGDPGQPDNTVQTGSVFTYLATVTYACTQNATLMSGDTERTCQASGNWSGTAPLCKSMLRLNNISHHMLIYYILRF